VRASYEDGIRQDSASARSPRLNRQASPTRKVSARWVNARPSGRSLKSRLSRRRPASARRGALFRRAVLRPASVEVVTTPSNETGHERPREEDARSPSCPRWSVKRLRPAQGAPQENKNPIAPAALSSPVSCRGWVSCSKVWLRVLTNLDRRGTQITTISAIGSDSWAKLAGPIATNRREEESRPTQSSLLNRLGRGDPTARADSHTSGTGSTPMPAARFL